MNRMFALGLLATVAGCDFARSCTLMYVPDGLEITIEAGAWEPGAWTASVDDLSCTVTLPGGADLACDEGLALELTDDAAGIAALSAWEHAPDTAVVTLALDGEEQLRETVTPVYEETEPNGKGCGVSLYGEAAVALP